MTTKTPEERIKELYKTGVPKPFTVEFAKLVYEVEYKEKLIHKILFDQRVNKRREFFRCDKEKIKNLFDLCEGEWFNSETHTNKISSKENIFCTDNQK